MRAAPVTWGIATLAFAACAIATVSNCRAMSNMGGMTMPGDWVMSMTWMRASGQSLPDAAGAFLGMWMIMMVAMMLPSLLPMLARYRNALGHLTLGHELALLSLVSSGYFLVWLLTGMLAFLIGAPLTNAQMRSENLARAVPIVTGLTMMIAGAIQFSKWKSRQLDCCRETPAPVRPTTATGQLGSALVCGLQLGVRCVRCCSPLTLVLLLAGVMDLRAMLAVTAAITLERLTPARLHAAQAAGAVMTAAALISIARAATH